DFVQRVVSARGIHGLYAMIDGFCIQVYHLGCGVVVGIEEEIADGRRPELDFLGGQRGCPEGISRGRIDVEVAIHCARQGNARSSDKWIQRAEVKLVEMDEKLVCRRGRDLALQM